MGSSFQVAFQRYIERLGLEERQECQNTSLQDFVAEAHSLQTSKVFRSRAHRFIVALDPLVQFLSKYASAVDTIGQYDVNPSAIVWGSLKALLVVRWHLALARLKWTATDRTWLVPDDTILLPLHEVNNRYDNTDNRLNYLL